MAHNEEEKQKLWEQRRQKIKDQRINCLSLVDVKNLTFEEAQELLKVKSETRLENIEAEKQKEIECYTIGKTFADKEEKIKFDRTNFLTWDLTGVANRFENKYTNLEYDFIEVVCGVTADSLPLPNNKNNTTESDKKSVWCKPDMYAIAFEQTLIQHFAFGIQDSRLDNTNLMQGTAQKDETKHAVGVVYIAVKLKGGDGRAPMPRGNLEKFDVSFKKDREGYAPNLIDLTDKSFKESETLLLQRCRSTVDTLVRERGPIKTFSIGISFATKLSKGDVDVSEFKTWKVQDGMSCSYRSISKHGYHLAIVLCGIKTKTIKSDNEANPKSETKPKQELQATAQTTRDDPKTKSNTKSQDDTHYDVTENLKKILVESVQTDKRHRMFCTPLQNKLDALIDKRAVCFAIFVALEFDKGQPEEPAADTARSPSDAEVQEVHETEAEHPNVQEDQATSLTQPSDKSSESSKASSSKHGASSSTDGKKELPQK